MEKQKYRIEKIVILEKNLFRKNFSLPNFPLLSKLLMTLRKDKLQSNAKRIFSLNNTWGIFFLSFLYWKIQEKKRNACFVLFDKKYEGLIYQKVDLDDEQAPNPKI